MKKFFRLLVLFSSGILPLQLFAVEPSTKKNVPDIKNIGFMEPLPKELKERFPMCDEFLKIEWIDKEKKIGYSRYNLYRDGKLDGEWLALVDIDDQYPHYDYDLSEFQKKGGLGLERLFSIIREGQVEFPRTTLSIRKESGPHKKTKTPNSFDNKKYSVSKDFVSVDFSTIDDVRDVSNDTLAEYTKNVCIPYPNNQRMWIAEYKHTEKVYSGQSIRAKSLKIAPALENEVKHNGLIPDRAVRGMSAGFDFNYDGIEDYFGWPIVYSHGNKYYSAYFLDRNNDKVVFPTTHNECHLADLGAIYLTTDGKSYFLNNECNLTELTK